MPDCHSLVSRVEHRDLRERRITSAKMIKPRLEPHSEGAIYRSVAPYRVTNVGRQRGRILAIGLQPQSR
jgi:hypothetical protein